MAFMTRTVASALLLAASFSAVAAGFVGCGPGANVQLTLGQRSCNVVEFGNCTLGATTLSLEPSVACDAVPNSGMLMTATSASGVVQACAAPGGGGIWFAWVSSTEENTTADMAVWCVPVALPCATTQICSSNYGCCTTPGYGSCSVAGGHTLSFGVAGACQNFGYSSAALSTFDGVNNASSCVLPSGASSWMTWLSLPSLGFQDTMNATCV